jgi:hypothetical protein
MLESAPMTDDERAKLRFDLANANLQSIGRAQGVYVTALLIYVCVVWSLVLVGPGGEAHIHIGLLDLNADGVWEITPFVILVLTLAYIGTVTAAVPAVVALRAAEKELFGAQEHSFFALDTHKNVVDYFAILQLLPWGKTGTPKDDGVKKPWSDAFTTSSCPLFLSEAHSRATRPSNACPRSHLLTPPP